MASITEQLDELRKRFAQRQKNPSGHGKGKWQTMDTIVNYRKKRDTKNKAQRKARKRNR